MKTMKPEKKTRIVEVTYYSCGLDDSRHFHKTSKAAKRCMKLMASKVSDDGVVNDMNALYSKDNSELADIPMSVVTRNMSTRSHTCLTMYGLDKKTIGDFLSISEKELLKNYRNFGRKSIDEICGLIESFRGISKSSLTGGQIFTGILS